MKKQEKNAILSAKTVAYFYCGSVFQTLEIKSIEYGIDDCITYVFTDADGTKTAHKAVVYTDADGRFYFNVTRKRGRAYIDACLRV